MKRQRVLPANLLTGLCAMFLIIAAGGRDGAAAQDHVARPIDPARFYKGTWLEVARRPMWITEGCGYGTTHYSPTGRPNEIHVRDACRKGGRAGPETVLEGPAEILDPGVNRRLNVRYNPLLSAEYHIVDQADDYSWFIETSPTLDNLFIYTRAKPSRKKLESLVSRARSLGFDTSNLEYPWGVSP
ncbi:MAG: lipocalin [Methylocystis sp.]|nr:MAG: lipocalin [Methylocystis sp.]